MANRKNRMVTWRASGHKHKKNKVSVADRKKIKRLQARKQRQMERECINK